MSMDEVLSLKITKEAEIAKQAAACLALASHEQRNEVLARVVSYLQDREQSILAANVKDVDAVSDCDDAFRDRLLLTPARMNMMIAGIRSVMALSDPLERDLGSFTRPNGLVIRRQAVPLGLIGFIYESRPNVTADAAALCIKSGNAVLLRSGSEAWRSSAAIVTCFHDALTDVGLPPAATNLLSTVERAAIRVMLGLDGVIDLIIPRGGASLMRAVQESRIPILRHEDGNCHTYVHVEADVEMASSVILNAKMRRVGVCVACESLLIDETVLDTHLGPVLNPLFAAGCEIRGDASIVARESRVLLAREEDWSQEYLAPIISVRAVSGLEAAIAHINRYGSHHTDAIVTTDVAAANRFLSGVDSAVVLHNASTQFADGGEFGFGAEIGISTGKLHARGPVGAEQLTSYKYVVHGNGQTRI